MSEAFYKTTEYVACTEQGTNLGHVLGELCVGDRGSRVFCDDDAPGDEHIIEEVQAISEELALADLQQNTGVIRNREDFFDMCDMVFGFPRDDQYVVEVDQACLEVEPRKDAIQAALEGHRSIA